MGLVGAWLVFGPEERARRRGPQASSASGATSTRPYALHTTGQAPTYLEWLVRLTLDAVLRMEDAHAGAVAAHGESRRRRSASWNTMPARPADPAAAARRPGRRGSGQRSTPTRSRSTRRRQ